MGGIEFAEFPEHHPPCFNFFSCVLHSGNGLTTVEGKKKRDIIEYIWIQIVYWLWMAEFLCYFNNYNYIEPVKKKTTLKWWLDP